MITRHAFNSIRTLCLAFTVTIACALASAAVARADPIPPAPREGDAALQEKWNKQHTDFAARAARGGIDLLLLGDSITNRWPADSWDNRFAPMTAVRFGIEGDQIQHLHWRLLHGEIDGVTPRVVMMLIGTNNVPRPFTPDQVADSTRAIVDLIRAKSPGTKVLVLSVLPRNEEASNIMRDRIRLINQMTSRLDNGNTVRFLDLSAKLTDGNGKISRETMPDFLHLSAAGYAVLMQSIDPLIREMAAAK